MSLDQSPPVTMITIPPGTSSTPTSLDDTSPTSVQSTSSTSVESTSSTQLSTTSSLPAQGDTATESTLVTTTTPGENAVLLDGPGSGIVLVTIFGAVILLALVLAIARRIAGDPQPAVVTPPGPSLTERVREAVAKAQNADPADHPSPVDVPVARLYPWVQRPDGAQVAPTEELTLVVDLRTAEALHGVGVTSLDQLAEMNDDMVRSMIDAGIDIDTRAVEAAAQQILGRRTGEDD